METIDITEQTEQQTTIEMTETIDLGNEAGADVVSVPESQPTPEMAGLHYKAKFVSEEGLNNLRYYKYSGEDKSLLVKYLLAPLFWNPLVTKLPKWLAPNTITLFGGVCMVLALLAVQFTMQPQDTPPFSTNVFVAIMIFLYQTADNLDGKQARRTQSSSALGELFDHGVDSIMIGIFGIIVAMNLQLTTIETLSLFLVMSIVFYLSHWEEYYVGTLVLGYFMNPTELQYGAIIFILFQSMFPEVGTFSFLTLLINEYLFFILLVGCIIGIASYVYGVYKYSVENNVPFVDCLSRLAQYVIFLVFSFTLIFCVNNDILDNIFVFWTITYTLILLNGYLTQRLVVKRICKEPIPYSDPILIAYAIFAVIISYFGISNNLSMVVITCVCLLITVFAFEGYLVYDICMAFCDRLHIRVFTINPPRDEEI